MSNEVKLWQRLLHEDQTSYLVELDGIDELDPDKPILICLPGVSTTHGKQRAINGYMGVAEKALGGRGANANVQIISVSYENTEEELENINRSNYDPLNYYSEGARRFAEKVIAPLIERGMDVNFFAKSFGPVFSRMATNALNDTGITPQPHQVRIVTTGSVARLNFERKEQSTAIFIEGDNDRRAAVLNRYKTAAPSNHDRLTITPLSGNALQVLTHVPETITFEKDVPGQPAKLTTVTDSERHTTRLYSTLGKMNRDQVILLQRVARNMLTLRGEEFTTETCLEPCSPLTESGKETIPDEVDEVVTANIAKALERGTQNQQLEVVLFDWDLTLVDGEKIYLKALNETFDRMAEAGYEVEGFRNWETSDMHENFYPTLPEFFERAYGDFGEEVVSEALQNFRNLRAESRGEAKVMPGAKELLRNLQSMGITVGVVSNKDEDELRAQKASLYPEPEFKDLLLIGKVNGRNGKPSDEAINKALTELGVPLDRAPSVLFVGDQMRSDVAAALEAGCRACLVGSRDEGRFWRSAKNVISKDDQHTTIQNNDGQHVDHYPSLISLAKSLGAASEGRSSVAL